MIKSYTLTSLEIKDICAGHIEKKFKIKVDRQSWNLGYYTKDNPARKKFGMISFEISEAEPKLEVGERRLDPDL